jgi:hypothetical protein
MTMHAPELEDTSTSSNKSVQASNKNLQASYYSYFQFIAYEVPTSTEWPAGALCETRMNLKPFVKDLSEDARIRLSRMIAVVEKAYDLVNDSGKNVLKVFMAPEFYFRPVDALSPSRSYAATDKVLVMAALGELVSLDIYADWLFVFGTIVWNDELKNVFDMDDFELDKPKIMSAKLNVANVQKSTEELKLVLNTALLGRRVLTHFDKQHYSGADHVNEKYQPEIDAAPSSKPKSKMPTSLKEVATLLTPTSQRDLPLRRMMSKRTQAPRFLLDINGVGQCAGVEVCVDHFLGTLRRFAGINRVDNAQETSSSVDLKNADDNNLTPNKLQREFALHLLTACGMEVRPKNLVVGEGRCVLRIDGSTFEKRPSEIQRVTGFDKSKWPVTTTRTGTLSAWEGLNKSTEIQLSDELTIPKPKVWSLQENEYDHPQQLRIYERLPFEEGVSTKVEEKSLKSSMSLGTDASKQ